MYIYIYTHAGKQSKESTKGWFVIHMRFRETVQDTRTRVSTQTFVQNMTFVPNMRCQL